MMEREDCNEQWQAEAEESRMAHNLDALERIARAGMPEIAQELAAELGLKDQFNQSKKETTWRA